MKCTQCKDHACDGKVVSDCASKFTSQQKIKEAYLTEENFEFARNASLVSIVKETNKTRIEELMDFAEMMHYTKLGLCFCIGLIDEAKIVEEIFEARGFQVVPVSCKTGGVGKELLEIENGGNAMCNPIGQAEFLNQAGTDFNVVLGLCVGHDSLFFKYSKAPATVLATKDKVLGHNPLACIYNAKGYYNNTFFK